MKTRFITQAIYNGTKQAYAIPGKSVDSCMKRIRRMRELRNASVFLFISRKSGQMIDCRFN